MPNLDALLSPRSVAVIGASTTPGKLGHTVLRNLVKAGFGGAMHAINSGGASVEGQPGWSSIRDVPGSVDCAFLAIPASCVEEAVKDCVAAGVRSVVVGAAGFAELGTEQGRQRQDRIAALASASGMRVLGPNTNGLMNLSASLSLGYNASHGEVFARGPVSIVSHSGALFDGIAKRLRAHGAGINKFVAVGNEADVTMLDLLDHLADDEGTRVIGLVVEGISDGARLRDLAQRLGAAGKSVVALKIGRSPEGASAALAHSSRLAGSARAWDAWMEVCGFSNVRTVEALAGACALLTTSRAQPERQLLCATTSGAGGAILADFAHEWHLPLAAPWNAPLAARVAELPTAAPMRHPIDLGSLGDWALFTPLLQMLEQAGPAGPMVMYAHAPASPYMSGHLVDALLARRTRCAAPLAVIAPGGLGAQVESDLVAGGVIVFHDTASCFESLACCFSDGLASVTVMPAPNTAALTPQHVQLLEQPAAVLSESDSAGLLQAFNVPMVQSRSASHSEQAVAAARELGYPVVLKAMAPGVAHKFKEGLVSLDIGSDPPLRREFIRQMDRVHALGVPAGTFWLIQPMRRGALELLLGTSHEEGLGDFLVMGLGGVHAEIWNEVKLVAMPASSQAVQAALSRSRAGRLLAGIDHSGGLCRQVVDALLSLQSLVMSAGDRIESVEINPFLVAANGCVAVDGLVVTR